VRVLTTCLITDRFQKSGVSSLIKMNIRSVEYMKYYFLYLLRIWAQILKP